MPEESFSGPFVSVACICQASLREANGVLSIIRVTDRVQVIGVQQRMQPQPLQNYSLVVILRSGELRSQTHSIKIVPITPTGKRLEFTESSVLFEGDERGPGFITPLAFVATEEGLYWFEVCLEAQVLTRIPLRVQYQKIQNVQMPFPPL